MKLPNCENAVVPQAKITEYLLSLTHQDGRSKARFFLNFGFSIELWEILADAFREHATNNEVAKTEASLFGTRFVIEGIIDTPDGRSPFIRTIWFTSIEENVPRFVTAYPLQRKTR